jgi:hypothetical protein
MRYVRRFLLILVAGVFVCALGVHAQDDDSPSLGDVARQTRQQRQLKDAQTKGSQAADSPASTTTSPQNSAGSKDTQARVGQVKDAQSKDAAQSAKTTSSAQTAKKVITNEEISTHSGPVTAPGPASDARAEDNTPSGEGNGRVSADAWKQQISAQKNAISQLESQIQDLSDSIRYAGGNCVANCQAWNEQQQRKQQQVESMTSQLGELQKHLDEMQEQARKQGYGSSVYDP